MISSPPMRQFLFTLMMVVLHLLPSEAQEQSQNTGDSVFVEAGLLVIMRDTFFVVTSDTLIFSNGRNIRLRQDPYARSKTFYDSLAVRTSKHRMMKKLHRLLVRDVNPVIVVAKNDKPRDDFFKKYKGKTIRSIRTLRIPLLEGDVNDTLWGDFNKWGHLLNWHPQTKSRLIIGRGLVKEGDRVKGSVLADMERLVRELNTIRDARLYVRPVKGTDSIDLVMATQDYFPLRASGNYQTPESFTMRISDRNITGSAVEAGIVYERNSSLKPDDAYSISVQQPNLFRRFLLGRLYAQERGARTEQGIEFSRGFLSEALHDIGGIFFRNITDRNAPDSASTKYKTLNGGSWYGRVFNTKYDWSIIPAISYEFNVFPKPLPESDFSSYFKQDRHITLASLNFIQRRFLRSALVKVFGISEYIPVGFSFKVIGGVEKTPVFSRNYAGGQAEFATFINDVGYFSASVVNSTFIREGTYEDKLRAINGTYYTPLLKLGPTRWRQFLDVDYKSVEKPNTSGLFTLKGPWSDTLGINPQGDEIYRVGLRTVFFMPWYVYGFRFSFYDGFEFNWIKSEGLYNNDKRYFPILRLGLRLQNDLLTYSAFSFQAAWSPSANNFDPFFSFTLKTFVLPLFTGLRVDRPVYLNAGE